MPWLPYLGMPQLVSELIDLAAPIPGKQILDMGTGTGFLAVLLASLGAEVHAIDVSPESLEVARRRAVISGQADKIKFYEMPCESLNFPDEYFDAVLGSFVLHHSDLSPTLKELARVMKPGAGGAFIETWGGNPLLMLARRLIPGRFGIEKSSSDDEAPLSGQAESLIKSAFPESSRIIFPELLFLRMLAVIPFLKRKPVYWLLENLDRLLFKIKALRTYSYFAVVSFQKNPAGS
jgi:ubiquinone/menaquinone biosynthesis C-methylase UbiE